MAQEEARGDVLQRIASIGFILGAILLIVFNVLFPRADDPSDTAAALTKLAENETWSQIVFLGIAAGMWSLLIGTAGVYRAISIGAGAAWVRLGFYGLIVGTTIATISSAIGWAETGAAADGIADMASVAYTAAATLYGLGLATFYMFIIVNWLALAFLGIGISLSDVYPKWLGWVAIVLGVVTVAVSGIPQALGDPTQTSDLIFAALALLTTLWALAMGVIILRHQMALM